MTDMLNIRPESSEYEHLR